jgi:hypothetical protein
MSDGLPPPAAPWPSCRTWSAPAGSHIAHQEAPEDNVEVFTRLLRSLKPGGALVICDHVVDDDRGGPAFPLTFAAEMPLKSKKGNTWRRADYHSWLMKAGFGDVSFHPAPPATLIIAPNAE